MSYLSILSSLREQNRRDKVALVDLALQYRDYRLITHPNLNNVVKAWWNSDEVRKTPQFAPVLNGLT